MSLTWIVIIVALVFGIIIGNILLLKYSTKFTIPKDAKLKKDPYKDDDEKDGW